jgi:hypothetical protein
LKAISDPKKWLRSDGRFTEVHTAFTTTAKELMDIYNGLKLRNISIDERLDILVNTKWTVKEWDFNLTREIVELIDREADMLNRGRPEPSLEGCWPMHNLYIFTRAEAEIMQFIPTVHRNTRVQPRSSKLPENPLRNPDFDIK